MVKECPNCSPPQDLEEGELFDRCSFCGYEEDKRGSAEIQTFSHFPSSDYSDDCSDKKSYEMKQIHPSGKNAEKYRWFICSPSFPNDKHKINNPHCHAWTDDRKGEARVSLNPSAHKIEKFRIKWGKIKRTDQNEIRKLVSENKDLIYQEWEKEWVPAYEKYFKIKLWK